MGISTVGIWDHGAISQRRSRYPPLLPLEGVQTVLFLGVKIGWSYNSVVTLACLFLFLLPVSLSL